MDLTKQIDTLNAKLNELDSERVAVSVKIRKLTRVLEIAELASDDEIRVLAKKEIEKVDKARGLSSEGKRSGV